jgi:hypothetical protein
MPDPPPAALFDAVNWRSRAGMSSNRGCVEGEGEGLEHGPLSASRFVSFFLFLSSTSTLIFFLTFFLPCSTSSSSSTGRLRQGGLDLDR